MSKYLLSIVVLFLAGCAAKGPSPSATSQPTEPTSVKTSLDLPAPTAAPTGEVTVGVVVVNVVNIREGPGTNYPAIGSLTQGEKFYVLGETVNSTNNKWLLISLPDNSFGWVIGEQSYVTVQKETADSITYATWQKNVSAAKSTLLAATAGP